MCLSADSAIERARGKFVLLECPSRDNKCECARLWDSKQSGAYSGLERPRGLEAGGRRESESKPVERALKGDARTRPARMRRAPRRSEEREMQGQVERR